MYFVCTFSELVWPLISGTHVSRDQFLMQGLPASIAFTPLGAFAEK